MDAQYSIDPSYGSTNEPYKHGEILLFQAILYQAVEDFLSFGNSTRKKFDALDWLIDEDDYVLQCSLSACNIDHNRLLRWVIKEAWNLDL